MPVIPGHLFLRAIERALPALKQLGAELHETRRRGFAELHLRMLKERGQVVTGHDGVSRVVRR